MVIKIAFKTVVEDFIPFAQRYALEGITLITLDTRYTLEIICNAVILIDFVFPLLPFPTFCTKSGVSKVKSAGYIRPLIQFEFETPAQTDLKE